MVIRRKRRPLNPRRRKNKSTILRMHFQTNRNILFNAYIKNTTHLLIFKGSEHEQINVGAKNGDLSLFDRAKILIPKLHKINFRFNSIRFSTKIRNCPAKYFACMIHLVTPTTKKVSGLFYIKRRTTTWPKWLIETIYPSFDYVGFIFHPQRKMSDYVYIKQLNLSRGNIIIHQSDSVSVRAAL